MAKYEKRKDLIGAESVNIFDYVDLVSCREAFELMANNENYDGTVETHIKKKSENSKTYEVLVTQTSKIQPLTFRSEYEVWIIKDKEGIDFFISTESTFSMLDSLCRFRYQLTDTLGNDIKEPKIAIFKMYISKVLKDKYQDEPKVLKEVQKLEDSAKAYIGTVTKRKEKAINATKSLLNLDSTLPAKQEPKQEATPTK